MFDRLRGVLRFTLGFLVLSMLAAVLLAVAVTFAVRPWRGLPLREDALITQCAAQVKLPPACASRCLLFCAKHSVTGNILRPAVARTPARTDGKEVSAA